jgi:carbonic anhydrase
VLEGSRDGRDLWLFDYRYTTGSGKSTSTTHQTVMLVRSARLKLPAFALAPEPVFHTVGEMFGFRDIDFDASPEFSRRFRLIGEEEERVRLLFNSRVLSFFEERKGVAVEGSDHELLFYRGGRTVSPREIRGLVDETLELVTRLES